MRLEQFYALVEIGQTSSMAKAAAKLHMSNQNVSKLINQLENELGVVLFTRSNKGVFLTPQGKEIYTMAVDIVKKTDSLRLYVDRLPRFVESVQGTLHLSSHINQTAVVVPLLEKMHAFYPNIRLSLSTELTMPKPEAFASGDCQVALASIPAYSMESLRHYKNEADIYIYREDTLKVVMNQNSPYINQSTLSLKTLSKQPFIEYTGNFSNTSFVRELFKKYGLSATVIFSCNDPILALEYIARNDAYCFGVNSIMQANSHATQLSIALKPLKEKIVMYNLVLVTKNKKGCAQEVDAIKEVLAYQFQDQFEPVLL
ncbi:MAG: LysR family transcriptional regulator [Peptococcaceae bacterium]|nr:LysR family transcriptional regulator [Peptococcaceae bacterium]